MRLTLRTLLAYLDDTLEPAQARLIGQKVAESDAAQELMARIKQVTRRRRLTSPPLSGPGAKTDPNSVAEYLDNTLSSEHLAEFEEICLASDVHLAETAACHQILTLVLGEPALVPPTSRQRMYSLVKGPEAIPFRKPPAARDSAESGAAEDQEADEALRLGLPAYGPWRGWNQPLALAAGGLALVALLAFAVWQVIPRSPRAASDRTRAEKNGGPREPGPGVRKDKDKGGAEQMKKDQKPRDRRPSPRDKGTVDKGKNDGGNKEKETDGAKDKKSDEDNGKKTKVEPLLPFAGVWQSANYVPPGLGQPSSILVRHGKDEPEWHRLEHKTLTVGVGDTLVSLPGYRSNVGFDNGLLLTLWGDLPEFSLLSPLQESMVVVNEPAKADLDLTLDHGRIVLANQRATRARVRIHFADPQGATNADQASWLITLKGEGATVGLELWGRYPPEIPFSLDKKKRLGPQTVLYLFVLKGEALVDTGDEEHAMKAPLRRADASPEPANLVWTSRGRVEGPLEARRLPDWFLQAYPLFPDWLSKPERESLEKLRLLVIKQLDQLSASMSGKKKVEGGLLEELTKKNPVRRALAIRCFGAIGNLPYLLDGLVDEKYPEVRQAAIESLRHWTGLKKENDLILYDTLMKTKGYSEGEARSIMRLLHSFSEKQRELPETYEDLIDYLSPDNKGAIKVLAHWHLVRLVPWGRKIAFDPLGESDQVEAAAEAWRKLVPKGTIPKPPKQKKGAKARD